MADVLIVDRDPDVRTMLGWFLSLQGHEVRGAGSAAEALDAITARTPEAMVLDAQLGDTSGHQLLSTVRAHGLAPDAAIVVVSTEGDYAALVRSWELGVCAHVTKPVAPEVVADMIAVHAPPRPLALAS